MIALDLLWWLGWAYFALWVALPLALVRFIGPVAGTVVWALVAPWSALAGMALAHRLLPPCREGVFRPFQDAGSIRWALKGWAPAVYLTVFQPIHFLSPAFQRVVLRAFGARIASGARITTRTSIREPHLLAIGRGSLVGEYVHLACSFQPGPAALVVGGIEIGDDVLVGAYGVLSPGCRIGSRSVLEYKVAVGANATVGADTRIGALTWIGSSVRIGDRVRIGKSCAISTGSVIPDGARLADHAVWSASTTAPSQRGVA